MLSSRASTIFVVHVVTILDLVSRSDGVACNDLHGRTLEVNGECCDETTEDCSSGYPATCNLGCARVLLSYFDDCGSLLGADGVAHFTDAIALCHAAKAVSNFHVCELLRVPLEKDSTGLATHEPPSGNRRARPWCS